MKTIKTPKTTDTKTRDSNKKASVLKVWVLVILIGVLVFYNFTWTASPTTGETIEQKVFNRNAGVKWQAQYRLDENKDSYLQKRFDFADELLQQNSITDITYEFDGDFDGNSNSDEKKGIEKWYVPRKKGNVSCL